MDINNDSGLISNVSVISFPGSTLTFSGTGALVPPTGTTAQRPVSPAVGTFRYNSDLSQTEYYNGTSWVAGMGTATLGSLSDASVIAPVVGQVLTWNGSAWANQSPTTYQISVSSWILVSGNLYSAIISHNLNSQNVAVSLWNGSNLVQPDAISIIDNNNIKVTVYGNTNTLSCVVFAGGASLSATSWTLVSGSLYSSTLTHNLGTQNVIVSVWNSSTNTLVHPDAVTIIDNNNVKVTVYGNSNSLRCVVMSAGISSAISIGSSAILRTLTYYASSLDSPNNADWAVNALAPAIADPTNTAMTVRQFSNAAEQGVGFYGTIPSGASNVTFRLKGRAQTAQGSVTVIQPKLYVRTIPNNAAVGAWSTAYNMSNVSIPTNAYTQYSSQTFLLTALGLSTGNMYQFELTRSATVSGGTNLPANWLLTELTLEFT